MNPSFSGSHIRIINATMLQPDLSFGPCTQADGVELALSLSSTYGLAWRHCRTCEGGAVDQCVGSRRFNTSTRDSRPQQGIPDLLINAVSRRDAV